MPIEQVLDELISLTIQCNAIAIKAALDQLPADQKGVTFEWYMTRLYQGNGWLAERRGGKGDSGADILLAHPKTPESIFWIVQCKNQLRSLSYDDTKIELVKFEEKAKGIYKCNQFRIIALNGFGKNAATLAKFNLDLEDWPDVVSLIEGYDPKNKLAPLFDLFPHNQRAFERVEQLWKESNRVAVVQATGTGKSYVIAKVMSKFVGRPSLVLAPSHPILDEVRSKVRWGAESIQFHTYAKTHLLTTSEVEDLRPDLIVLDEFHRCGADLWGLGVQRILDAFPNAYVLGTTATPTRYLDSGRNMADELFHGRVAENMSLFDAIVRRILPMPTYVCAFYDLQEEARSLKEKLEHSKVSDEDKESIRRQIRAATVAWENASGVPAVLTKHVTGDLLKFIVFCEDVKHLNAMEEVVRGWFQKAVQKKRASYRVVSEESDGTQQLAAFRNAQDRDSVHLLFSIAMLNEGVHVEDLTGVILLRRTASPILYYQQIGRCFQVGTQRTPLIFDFVNNFRSIRAADFSGELRVAQKDERKRRAACGLPDNSPTISIIDETREAVRLFEEIENRLSPKEVVLSRTHEFCRRYRRLDCLPKQNSQNQQERDDANWLSHKRQAKKGRKKGYGFYPEMDAIAVEHGMDGLFDTVDFRQRAIERTHILCKQILAGRVALKVEIWMKNVRQYKQRFLCGESIGGYYPELEEVAASYGLKDIFDVQDFKEIALNRLREICTRSQDRGHPPATSSPDEQERSDAGVISRLRTAKQGKGKYQYFPEMELILSEFGLAGLLDSLDERLLRDVMEFCARYQNRKLPTARANDPNRRDGQWLSAKRQIKAGRRKGVWSAKFDEIAHQFGLNGLFEFDVVTEERATDWVRRYLGRNGTYPTTTSGHVHEANEDGYGYRHISWNGVHRRFPLNQLAEAIRPEFSPEHVKKWNDEEIAEGRPPITKSGTAIVVAAQRDGCPLTGSAINSRLRSQFEVSLAELLRRSPREPFSIELAAKWVRSEFDRNGSWPTAESLQIPAAAADGYENLSGNALNKRLKRLGTTIGQLKRDLEWNGQPTMVTE